MQFLKLKRFCSFGAYLSDEAGVEVLLPNRYINKDEHKIDSLVWVFVYTDSEDRIVSITTTPKAFVNDIASLEVVSIEKNGIYLDLGIPKDIFMPSKNPHHYKINQKVVVKILLDKQNRLIARANISDFLSKAVKTSKNLGNKSVKILPFLKTDIGLNCVVNDKYFGIIHNNDLNRNLEIGETCRAFVKKIRADGKLDLGLKNDTNANESLILEILLKNNNRLNIDFDSSPELIKNTLNMSKKAFKAATSSLIKAKKVAFIKDGNKFILAKK